MTKATWEAQDGKMSHLAGGESSEAIIPIQRCVELILAFSQLPCGVRLIFAGSYNCEYGQGHGSGLQV